MKSFLKSIMFAAGMMAVSCTTQTQEHFRIVLLPDTQTYSAAYPEIFQAQTQWIAEHADSIAFVLQQGDITDRNTEDQWNVAVAAMTRLDGVVPYVVAVGNHDLGENGHTQDRNSTLFNRFFPYEKYSREPYFGGAYEPGKMENIWCTFHAGGIDWLVLSLEFGPRDEVLNWAGEVVAAHPHHKVIVNTHAYLYSDDKLMGPGHEWLPQSYGVGSGSVPGAVNNGQEMWDKFVSRYPNIAFVFCGHVLNDGTGCLVSEGVHGNKVCQILANYQGGTIGCVNGGNGFLRIVDVDVAQGKVSVRSYSPYTDTYRTEPDQQFVVEGLDFGVGK